MPWRFLDAGRSSAWLPLYSPASKNLHNRRHLPLYAARELAYLRRELLTGRAATRPSCWSSPARSNVTRRENIIAVGNSGTGKTHICLGLGLAACQKVLSVGFNTAAALVHEFTGEPLGTEHAGPFVERQVRVDDG